MRKNLTDGSSHTSIQCLSLVHSPWPTNAQEGHRGQADVVIILSNAGSTFQQCVLHFTNNDDIVKRFDDFTTPRLPHTEAPTLVGPAVLALLGRGLGRRQLQFPGPSPVGYT